jgi:hypothetical protein
MTIEEQINTKISEIKGIREPTRNDIYSVLEILVEEEKCDKDDYMKSYLDEVSSYSDKIMADLQSYPNYETT